VIGYGLCRTFFRRSGVLDASINLTECPTGGGVMPWTQLSQATQVWVRFSFSGFIQEREKQSVLIVARQA